MTDIVSFSEEKPAATEEPQAVADPQPAPLPKPDPEPIIIEAPKLSRWMTVAPIAACCLAVVASSASVAGLIVASRTVASASLVVADARERQEHLKEVEALVAEVRGMRQREMVAMARLERMTAAKPVTTDDLKHVMDAFKANFERHQPENTALGLVRDGQAELAERIGQISMKLSRVEEKLSSSRPASRAVGREPTS
jgi:uncharacterized protein YpuA (DUF1002 family)